MSKIDYEQDRVQSVTQADAAKSLSDRVIELKNLEDEISNAEESVSKLKEKAKTLSQFEIPKMMEEMHITKLKLKDGGYEPVQKIGVHPQTLKAVVRERLESGQEMPSDIIKTYAGNSTKITRR